MAERENELSQIHNIIRRNKKNRISLTYVLVCSGPEEAKRSRGIQVLIILVFSGERVTTNQPRSLIPSRSFSLSPCTEERNQTLKEKEKDKDY